MRIPQFLRTMVGLLFVAGFMYVVWVFKWWLISAAILYACIKGLLEKENVK